MANPREGQKRKASNTDEKKDYSKKRKDFDEDIFDNDLDDASTQIGSLPDDVLIEIIKLTPVGQWPCLEKVSRRFRAAVFEAWRGLKKIRLDEELLDDNVTKKEEDAVKVLNVIVKELICRTPKITDLSGFLNIVLGLKHAPLRLSRSGNSKLEKLTIFGLDTMDASRLTKFNLNDISFGPIYLISLIARAKNLASIEFDFRTIYENANDDVRLEETKQLLRAIATMENLSSLKISDNRMIYSFCRQIRSEFVEMIAELGRRGRLEEFLLPDGCICTKGVVSAIANNMTHLKSLELCPDYKSKKVSMVELVTNLKRLENFRLTRLPRNMVNDETIAAIAANMLNLTCLHLQYTSRNQPESLKELAILNNLKELCIEANNDIKVDTSTMEAWSEAFGSKLEVLRFSRGIKITKKGLIAMINKATRLQHLMTGDMTATDRRLLAIASSCRDLRKLEVAPSRKLTIKGIQAVVDGCPRLERFGNIYCKSEIKKVCLEADRKLEFVYHRIAMTLSHAFWDWP